MLTEERKQQILALLEAHSVVKSKDLMTLLNASESTIRRDLQELEQAGHLQRIHGGAKQVHLLNDEPNMLEKSLKNIQEKRQIAQLAAEEVADDDVIYIDAGTTTIEMIPFLAGKRITVVTNSVAHAAKLVDAAIPTIILGGSIKLSTNAVLGSSSMLQLKSFQFNKAFMGMNGVHGQLGFTTPDLEEAALKRLAMEHAQEVFVLVDESKLNAVTFTQVAPIEAATIVTNQCSPQLAKEFQEKTTLKEGNK